MWWYLLLLVGVMLFLSPSTSGTSIFCWLEACDGASVPSNSIWKYFWCFQGSYEKQFWYFQVLPSTSKARVWKVLLVLAQQYEACSGAWVETFRAQWVSGGRGLLTGHLLPSSFTNTNTQIHKNTNTPMKMYKVSWSRLQTQIQIKARNYAVADSDSTIHKFSYLIQITPQSDDNNILQI